MPTEVEIDENYYSSNSLESDEQASSNENVEPANNDPKIYEALKTEIDSLKSQLPNDDDRRLLNAIRDASNPKQNAMDEGEQKLQNAIRALSEKGVLTSESKEVQEALEALEELKQEKQERIQSAVQAEGYRSIRRFELELSLLHEELDEKQQVELANYLNPFYTKKGLHNPVGAIKAYKAFKAKLESAELPSKSIDTSVKGASSEGTKATGGRPSRAEYFRNIFPKLSEEQQQKVLSSSSKPYSDY